MMANVGLEHLQVQADDAAVRLLPLPSAGKMQT